MAIADAKQWQVQGVGEAYPLRGLLAPRQPVGDHRPGAADDGAADCVDSGQELMAIRAKNPVLPAV